MGGKHQTGHLPNEDQKLDSLSPGSREMEEGRWEDQNFQQLKKVQRLEEEEEEEEEEVYMCVCVCVYIYMYVFEYI